MAKGSNAVVAKDKKTLKYSKKQYLKWYEEMLLYRKFEEKASACYIQQKIRGFCHLYIGQEAIIAGYETSLGKGDSVITTYRDHCQPIGCNRAKPLPNHHDCSLSNVASHIREHWSIPKGAPAYLALGQL